MFHRFSFKGDFPRIFSQFEMLNRVQFELRLPLDSACSTVLEKLSVMDLLLKLDFMNRLMVPKSTRTY